MSQDSQPSDGIFHNGKRVVSIDRVPGSSRQPIPGSLAYWDSGWRYHNYRAFDGEHHRAVPTTGGEFVVEFVDGSRQTYIERELPEAASLESYFSGSAYAEMMEGLTGLFPMDGKDGPMEGTKLFGMQVTRAYRADGTSAGGRLVDGSGIGYVLAGHDGQRETATVPNPGDWVVVTSDGRTHLVGSYAAMRLGLGIEDGRGQHESRWRPPATEPPRDRWADLEEWLLRGRLTVNPLMLITVGLFGLLLSYMAFWTVLNTAFPPKTGPESWTFRLEGRAAVEAATGDLGSVTKATSMTVAWGTLKRPGLPDRVLACQFDSADWARLSRAEDGKWRTLRADPVSSDCDGLRSGVRRLRYSSDE